MKMSAVLFLHFKSDNHSFISLMLLTWMRAHAKQFNRNRLKICEFQPDFHTDGL